MDPLIILLIVVTLILTTLLVIVGIQVILILKEIRQTLSRVNQTLDQADRLLASIGSPFAKMGGMLEGVRSGLKVAETFVNWVKKHPSEDDE